MLSNTSDSSEGSSTSGGGYNSGSSVSISNGADRSGQSSHRETDREVEIEEASEGHQAECSHRPETVDE